MIKSILSNKGDKMIKSILEQFEKIESISSRNQKAELLQELYDNQKEASLFLLETAFNPYLIFGIDNFDDGNVYATQLPTIEQLKNIRDKLVNKELTGHAARDAIRSTVLCEDELCQKWLVRIFQKNLRMGASNKTVNKVFDNLIPTFEIGLCDGSYEYKEGTTTSVPDGEWAMEPKYDGLRCICIIDEKGYITFQSRNGKELFNLDHIKQQLHDSGLKSVMLDGEAMGDNWNDSISVMHSSKTEQDDPTTISFYIFDMISLDEWAFHTPIFPWSVRKQKLFDSGLDKCENIQIAPSIKCEDFKQTETQFRTWRNEGYEGAVLKDVNALYPFKRTKEWTKWKEVYDCDIPIVEALIGTGKNKNKLGAFLCDFNGVMVKVGSGYSDQQREEFWEKREHMIGTIIEVQYQEITKDGSLRFPVFLRTRLDKEAI